MWEKIIRALPISFLLLLSATSFASNPAVQDAINHAKDLMHDQRLSSAKSYLDRAIALDPNNVDARLDRAYVLSQLGEASDAVKDLDVVFKQGKYQLAYQYRSEVMFMLGEPKKSLEDISVALSMATNDESKLYCLERRAELYSFFKKPEKALVDVTAAMALKNVPHPKNSGPVLLNKRAHIYLELGDYEKAIADFTSLLATKKPNDVGRARLYALRSAAYEKIGRHDLAEADKKKSDAANSKEYFDLK